jgi:hypothetical protein
MSGCGYVAQYFVSGAKPLIALEYDDGGGMAVKHAVEKRKHLARHGVTVSVGENRFVKALSERLCLPDGFLHQPGRQASMNSTGLKP